MEKQVYSNSKEKIEAYVNGKSSIVMSSIHPISKVQIILLPESRLYGGTNWDKVKEELMKLVNREERTEMIVDNIIKETKAYVYSYQP